MQMLLMLIESCTYCAPKQGILFYLAIIILFSNQQFYLAIKLSQSMIKHQCIKFTFTFCQQYFPFWFDHNAVIEAQLDKPHTNNIVFKFLYKHPAKLLIAK